MGLRTAVSIVFACLVVGCASSSQLGAVPGVTRTSVTFGTTQPLSGPAAPGYDEIAQASQAYLDYVNARGGVYGRAIHLIVENDAYDPEETVAEVQQLVLEQPVFGIFEGLGTPTQLAVTRFLNGSKVPDVFVGSGCSCWENGRAQPEAFGWQPNYTIEGKILGRYIARHMPGERVGVLYEDDAFGLDGLSGIQAEVPAAAIATRQPYQAGATTLVGQVKALKAARVRVLVDFTTPIYTALEQWTALVLDYRPQLVVSSAGNDPHTLARLLQTVSAGRAPSAALLDGAITDWYLPSPSDTSNSWVKLFLEIRARYDPNAPWDTNVEYGMASAYTLVQALRAAGRNLTRKGFVGAIQRYGDSWRGPGLVGFRYGRRDHSGYDGSELAEITNGELVPFGGPLSTRSDARSAITRVRRRPVGPPPSGIPTS